MIRMLFRPFAGTILVIALLASAPVEIDERWELGSLHPSDPQSYFLLAEEVADASSTEAERRLAIRLFAIAATLDARNWEVASLRGIVGLVDDESTMRTLRAMLALAEDAPSRLLPGSMVAPGRTDQATIAAFDVLSWSRCGRRVDARRLLRDLPGVRERLLVHQDDVAGGMGRLIDELSAPDDPSSRRSLTEAQLVAQLQVQLRLLGGREDSWSGSLTAWRGRPMERLSSHDLGTLLGLDLSRQVWRSNGWRPIEEDQSPSDGDEERSVIVEDPA